MPNKPAAVKALRQAKKATLKHLVIKEKLDNLEQKIKKALQNKNKESLSTLSKEWQKVCDKAARTKTIKKNTANRLKSRIMKRVKSLKN